nr:hypothetical protein [Ornithinimicrobium cerasi]
MFTLIRQRRLDDDESRPGHVCGGPPTGAGFGYRVHCVDNHIGSEHEIRSSELVDDDVPIRPDVVAKAAQGGLDRVDA